MQTPTTGWWTPQTITVHLDDDHLVVLRKPTWGEQQEAISRSAKVDAAQGTMIIDFARMRLEQLTQCVVDWQGPNFEGVPVTPDNVAALPMGIGNRLLSELEAFIQDAALDTEKEKNLAAPTSDE